VRCVDQSCFQSRSWFCVRVYWFGFLLARRCTGWSSIGTPSSPISSR
jgi:hypothetical protein